MNERIRLTVIFSAPAFPYSAVLDALAPALGVHFSGACCTPVDGVWSADGSEFKDRYQAGQQEPGMRIVLTLMPAQRDAALVTLQGLLQTLKRELALAISWVHVEEETVRARHFLLD